MGQAFVVSSIFKEPIPREGSQGIGFQDLCFDSVLNNIFCGD